VIINSLTKSGIIQFVSIKDEIKLWWCWEIVIPRQVSKRNDMNLWKRIHVLVRFVRQSIHPANHRKHWRRRALCGLSVATLLKIINLTLKK
jgi:hypothetical protein